MGTIRDVTIGSIGDTDTGKQFVNGITWNGTAGGDSWWISNVHIIGCTGNGINNPNGNASDMHIENLYLQHLRVGFYNAAQEIYGTNWEFSGNALDFQLLTGSSIRIRGFDDTGGGYPYSNQMVVNVGGRLDIEGGSFYEQNGSSNVTIIDNSQGGSGWIRLKDFAFNWNPGYTGTWQIQDCQASSGQPSDLHFINVTGLSPSAINCQLNWANAPAPVGVIEYQPRNSWGTYHTDAFNILSKMTGVTFDWTRHDSEHQYDFWGGPIELIQVPSAVLGSGCTPTGSGSTSYGYRVTATTGQNLGNVSLGGETLPNTEVTCSNASTLSSSNYNTVSIGPVVGATGYNIYCRTPGAELLCGSITATGSPTGGYTWVDNGSATPSGAMPTANTTGRLVGGIISDSSYDWTKNLDIGADGHVTGTAGKFSSLQDTGLISAPALGTDSNGNVIAESAGQVSSVTGSTGVTVSPTTGAVVVSANCDSLNTSAFCMNEEFPTPTGTYNWAITKIGASGAYSAQGQNNSISLLSNIQINAGTNAGQGGWYQIANLAINYGVQTNWDSHFYFGYGGSTINARIGYATSASTTDVPANGLYVRYDQTLSSLATATYVSGGSATGSTGQTCNVAFNGGTATATIALTGTNSISGGTFTITSAGAGYNSTTPTSAALSSGTATCSGTAAITSTVNASGTGADTAYMACSTSTSFENCASTGLALSGTYDLRIRAIASQKIGMTLGAASEITFCSSGCTVTLTPTNSYISPSFEVVATTSTNSILNPKRWHFEVTGVSW